MVRSAEQGLLTVTDSEGRVVAETSSGAEPDALMIADVRPGSGPTFYSRAGDWFGWVNVCVAAILGVLAMLGLGARHPVLK